MLLYVLFKTVNNILQRRTKGIFFSQSDSLSSTHTIVSPAMGRIIPAEGGGNGLSTGSMARAINSEMPCLKPRRNGPVEELDLASN